ncbi:hypothetical protein NQ318_013015 [Aromia moschata]|uniref:Uncharacterized protein n=1 Tax=Aromia moschata TaxID=1265417 RepID=A0AAV8XWZ7_9CUCU|nr:hypothetical protein NQ318_013015 [Aromia moschata]
MRCSSLLGQHGLHASSFLWGRLKSLVYAETPEKIEQTYGLWVRQEIFVLIPRLLVDQLLEDFIDGRSEFVTLAMDDKLKNPICSQSVYT